MGDAVRKSDQGRERPQTPSATPEPVRFPPRERPGSSRKPAQETPYDVEMENGIARRVPRAQPASDDSPAQDAAPTTAATHDAGPIDDAARPDVAQPSQEREPAATPTQRRRSTAASQAAARAAAERAQRVARSEAPKPSARQGQPQPDLATLVWEAKESLREAGQSDPAERVNYVPIAREASRAASDAAEDTRQGTYVTPYNLPDRRSDPAPNRTDPLRRAAQSVSALALAAACIVLLGQGVAAPLESGGSLLAPLGIGWLMWGLVAVLGLAAAAFAWTGGQRSARRQRAVGFSAAVASAAGAVWLVAAANGTLWLALLAAALQLAAAWRGAVLLNQQTARDATERRLTDLPLELALGWAGFVTASTLSALLTSLHLALPPAALWAGLGLALAALPACLVSLTERGRLAPAVGFGWGALMVLIPRLVGPHASVGVALAAAATLVVVALTALARRQEIVHAERGPHA